MLRTAILVLLLAAAPADASLPSGFEDELIHGRSSVFIGLEVLPDGRCLIAQQHGVLGLVTTAGVFASVDTVANVATDVENGFLGIVADPGWPTRPYVYYFFTRNVPDSAIVIQRRTASGDMNLGISTNLAFDEPFRILVVPNPGGGHNGGALRFGPDGMLYVSIGDDQNTCISQRPELLQGVVLRLDVSALPPGSGGPPPRWSLVPPDNPFVGAGDDRELVYAYGFRNPFRFDIDSTTGKLYIADVGEYAWEELDESVGGENFGWPLREGYEPFPENCGGGSFPIMTDPILALAHNPQGGNAIGGGLVYRRRGGAYEFPTLYEGLVFYTEFYSGVWRCLQNLGPGWYPLPEIPGQPNAQDWGTGITLAIDMDQGPDGAIYYVTYFGELRRITYVGSQTGVGNEPVALRPLRAVPNPVRLGQGSALLSGAADARTGDTCITVFDARGRWVTTLDGARWDLGDHAGRPVAPGTYFYRVEGKAGASGRVTVLP